MKKLLKQAGQFLLVSGTGWLLDFGIFSLLAYLTALPVGLCNVISAIPSLTLVFVVSTRRIFKNSAGKLPAWAKYAIWLAWQMLLLAAVSALAQWLYGAVGQSALNQLPLVARHLKVLCKLAITPFTMVANFLVMRRLAEKL